MRIVILTVFLFSLPSFGSIDRTRLQMELDYLLEEARDIDLQQPIKKADQKQAINNNLKFKRAINKSDILPLEEEFDSVKTQYSAPRRMKSKRQNQEKEVFIESEQKTNPVRMNGLVPKDLFKE